jgi:hypothetical protein
MLAHTVNTCKYSLLFAAQVHRSLVVRREIADPFDPKVLPGFNPSSQRSPLV